MSTHGRIGIVRKNGSVVSIYTHWDSYPSYMGNMLFKNYKDQEKVERLISLGDIDSLKQQVDIPNGSIHTFDNPQKNITIAFHRDGGLDFCNRTDESEEAYWKSKYMERWGYLFKNGKWFYADGSDEVRKVRKLTRANIKKELENNN